MVYIWCLFFFFIPVYRAELSWLLVLDANKYNGPIVSSCQGADYEHTQSPVGAHRREVAIWTLSL